MKEGQISRVVPSPYGYHIFRLDKWIEARLVPLEDAVPSIRAKLADQKAKEAVAAHLDTLKAGIDWKARTENLPFAYQRNET
jgi:parvulin-like peptidyl-prolyl isomerase